LVINIFLFIFVKTLFMGYTHYFRRPKQLGTPEEFKFFADDCQKIFDFCENELDIKLANGASDIGSRPEVTSEEVFFNGSEEQPIGVWTTTEQISIPWPSSIASIKDLSELPFEKTDGNWFGGDLVSQRVAPINKETGLGSGSYETFGVERIVEEDDYRQPDEDGLYFDFCKTAYRPYDLVVTSVLIALKKHYPKCEISTDGEEKDWLDARVLCNNLLGYGFDVDIKV
jgi:hypothetical protein